MNRESRTFEVLRTDLKQSRFVDEAITANDGELIVRVDEFALTSNNITYARLGETADYWRYFPSDDPQWGRIPAWGNATVIESNHANIGVGDRYYGFVPMSSRFLMRPDRVGPAGFVDTSEHRNPLSRVYNAYRPIATDSLLADHLRPIFEPVFILSFLLDLAVADRFGTDPPDVLVTSASSKAAIGTAHLLHGRGVPTIAATSARNAEFCASLDCYADVVTYDELDMLADRSWAVVDISGNQNHTRVMRKRLGDQLVDVIHAGFTHRSGPAIRSLDAHTFNAPQHIINRTRQWGRTGFAERLADTFDDFLSWSEQWATVDRIGNEHALTHAYLDVVNGNVHPARSLLATVPEFG